MRAPGELSERKAAILRDLVHLYIRTGEPVGSEALAAFSRLGVSSATIRNELSTLEEMGYLTQPHPSAGRQPTELGYRSFVNMLPAKSRLRDQERLAIVHFFDEALADVDEILKGTTHLLSRLTRYASLALAPSIRESTIARAELIQVGSGTLLLVVFEDGRVEKRLVDVPATASDEVVDRMSKALLELFTGKSLGDAATAATERLESMAEDERTILTNVTEALGSIGEAHLEDHVFLGGMANIAAEQAFQSRETLREMLEAIERESGILRLLREAATSPAVSVTIGSENPVTGIWEASVVAAPYDAGGRTLGTIGVVGPLRMDYAAAISAVRAVADRLSAAVAALGGPS
jgi:heat-inducible transcriptional repressor